MRRKEEKAEIGRATRALSGFSSWPVLLPLTTHGAGAVFPLGRSGPAPPSVRVSGPALAPALAHGRGRRGHLTRPQPVTLPPLSSSGVGVVQSDLYLSIHLFVFLQGRRIKKFA